MMKVKRNESGLGEAEKYSLPVNAVDHQCLNKEWVKMFKIK